MADDLQITASADDVTATAPDDTDVVAVAEAEQDVSTGDDALTVAAADADVAVTDEDDALSVTASDDDIEVTIDEDDLALVFDAGVPGARGEDGAPGATGATGPTGPPGAHGATILEGHGPPSNYLGSPGDLYFDVDTGDVYAFD